MLPRWTRTVLMAGVACVVAGCSEQSERLNAPPQGDTDRPNELQEHFVYMVDKGMLHDASIADIHFEPHSAELSGTGIRRLMRMGELMTETGGTIHYETDLGDQELVSRRLEVVREFLLASGFDMARIEVQAGLSQGRGMSAERAILAGDAASGVEPAGAGAASGGTATATGAPPAP